jgi:hypothetical protein
MASSIVIKARVTILFGAACAQALERAFGGGSLGQEIGKVQ